MFVGHIDEIEKKQLSSSELKGVSKQVPLGPEQGWEDHVMRVFTVQAGGHTPKHQHPWPHINYVIRGKGTLYHDGAATAIRAGSVAYMPGGTEHQFVNDSDSDLAFICIVPEEGEK